jgi:hypothetical protein
VRRVKLGSLKGRRERGKGFNESTSVNRCNMGNPTSSAGREKGLRDVPTLIKPRESEMNVS